MLDIEELKPQIIETLIPLKPDKIILFGSLSQKDINRTNKQIEVICQIQIILYHLEKR